MSKNAVYDMLYCTFIFPAVYAGDGMDIRTFKGWIHMLLNVSPAIFSMSVGLLYYFVKYKRIGALVFLAGLFTVIVLCLGYNYLHYYTMTAPVFTVSLVLLLELYGQGLAKQYRLLPVLTLAMILCVVTYYGIRNVDRLKTTFNILVHREYIAENQKMYSFFMPIPQEELDEVYFYNANTYPAYLMNIAPYYKYSNFQESYIKLNPNINSSYTLQNKRYNLKITKAPIILLKTIISVIMGFLAGKARLSSNHLKKLRLIDNLYAKLLRLCKLAAGGFARQNIICFCGYGA